MQNENELYYETEIISLLSAWLNQKNDWSIDHGFVGLNHTCSSRQFGWRHCIHHHPLLNWDIHIGSLGFTCKDKHWYRTQENTGKVSVSIILRSCNKRNKQHKMEKIRYYKELTICFKTVLPSIHAANPIMHCLLSS